MREELCERSCWKRGGEKEHKEEKERDAGLKTKNPHRDLGKSQTISPFESNRLQKMRTESATWPIQAYILTVCCFQFSQCRSATALVDCFFHHFMLSQFQFKHVLGTVNFVPHVSAACRGAAMLACRKANQWQRALSLWTERRETWP